MAKSQPMDYTNYRIFGYVATIIMHSVNIWYMNQQFHGDILKEPSIAFFINMQKRFFTGWTFVLQIAYAITGLTCDLLALASGDRKNYKLNKYLRGFRDTLFAGVLWPSTLVVSTFFWGLYNYDRNLIMPEILDKLLPLSSNHVIHTAIVAVVLWELVFRPRRIPRSHKRNLGHTAFHFGLYFSVLMYTYYETGKWLYPVVGKIYGTVYFPLTLAAIIVIVTLFYYIQWPLTRLFWGNIDEKKVR